MNFNLISALTAFMLIWIPSIVLAEGPPPSLVEVSTVMEGDINSLQSFVGTLYYDRKANVAAEQEGVVAQLHFAEGQKVDEGDLLVTLDSSILLSSIKAKEASLRAQQAELTFQKRELERNKTLVERQSIAETTYERLFYVVEQSKAQSEVLENEIAALRIELGQMQVKAPFKAVVTERSVDKGEWVAKGAKVATLVAPASIEARVNVPTRLLPTLKLGQQMQAEVSGRIVETKIKSIIPVADISSRTFPVEFALLEDINLIEGMRINVKLPTLKTTHSLLVPRDAVIKQFGQNVVFCVVEGKAVMFPAQVIGYKENLAAIEAEGLAVGMLVVVKGNERIFPDSPVIVIKGNS
jgi:membrane fusion protein (multidrug efflux system)